MGDAVKILAIGDVIINIEEMPIEFLVYMDLSNYVGLETKCFCMDVNSDDFELGSDDFTPKVAEDLGFESFLFIRDILNINSDELEIDPTASPSQILAGAQYYFEFDAFRPRD